MQCPLTTFLSESPGRLGLISDYDADGLSAAVLMECYLTRLDRDFELRTPCLDRNVWDTPREQWLAPDACAAIVMDLGCRGDKLFPVPTLFIDHHKSNPPAPGDRLITGYGRDPVPTTAGLVWELVGDSLPHKKWLAALGTFGDLGTKAPFPYLQEAKKEFTAKALGEVVSLVNAARRINPPRVEVSLGLLREYPDPKTLLKSQDPRLGILSEVRERVRTEMEKGKQAAPVFSDDVALIVVSSDCQIHPVIAQIWRTRLPKYYVIVANTGYQEGRVHFSGRSRGDKKILRKLRALKCWAEDSGFGQGHDQAAGGVVSVALWETILDELGFESQTKW